MADSPPTQYLQKGDGTFLAYQVVGDRPPNMLFAIGLASHVEHLWDLPVASHLFRRLASFSRVISFDVPGTGMSDPFPLGQPPTPDQQAHDVVAVLDAAGAGQAVLLGRTNAAAACIRVAVTRPERVAALVLWGTYARWMRDDDYPFGLPDYMADRWVEASVDAWGTGASLDLFAPRIAADPAMRDLWAHHERMAASPGRFRALCRMWFSSDVRDLLSQVDVPTLVVHATDDQLVRVEHGRYLAAHIPGARLVEIADADHLTTGAATEVAAHAIEEFVSGKPAPVPAERVLATVVFIDISKSTETAARLGDHRWHELLDEFRGLVRRELERHGGREVDTRGDDFLALFDVPARAIACTVAVRTGARSLGLDVTSGIHTGEIERRRDGVAGLSVHIGARIAALAEAGEILVSSTVKDLAVGSELRFSDRGSHTLKGVPDEWRIFEVQA